MALRRAAKRWTQERRVSSKENDACVHVCCYDLLWHLVTDDGQSGDGHQGHVPMAYLNSKTDTVAATHTGDKRSFDAPITT